VPLLKSNNYERKGTRYNLDIEKSAHTEGKDNRPLGKKTSSVFHREQNKNHTTNGGGGKYVFEAEWVLPATRGGKGRRGKESGKEKIES